MKITCRILGGHFFIFRYIGGPRFCRRCGKVAQ